MLTYWEILTAIQSDIPIYDSYAKLWGEKLSSDYTIDVYTGALPAVLTGTKAGYLQSYKIYGNTEQNGAPTPSDPIYPSECGELETTGVHAGQYKFPLTSAGQDVDIYIGESQTTRRIKKLVLTGEENWGYNDSNHTAYLTTLDSFLGEGVSVISTHYTAVSNKTAYTQLSDKQCCLRANGNYLWVRDDDYSTAGDFKAYLQQQYANGTPVTVWYILAEPETAVLNEPLRKIGNYADTIDSTQTSAQIPTAANSTTVNWAGEGIPPSQVEFIYKAKR